MQACAGLARCVGDAPRFLEESWGRRACLHHGEDYDDLLALGHVDHILSTMALRAPAFRLVKAGATLARSTYTRRGRLGSRDLDDLIDVGAVYAHFEAGATIVLQGLHRYWPPVTALCRELEASLTHPVQANAYITPPVSQGLRVHADAHDVLALQTHGRKQWVLYEDGPEAEPTLDATLEPGDCLYVPQGAAHAARTVDAASVHLTVGIRTVTWGQALRRALDLALRDPALSESLPAGFAHDPAAIADEFGARLQGLAETIAKTDGFQTAASAAERFWARRPPVLDGHLVGLLALDALTDDSVVAVRPHATAQLRAGGRRLHVVLGDRTLVMPARVEPALRLLLDRGRVRVAELSDHLDAPSRLVLARRLVREGLLLVVTPRD